MSKDAALYGVNASVHAAEADLLIIIIIINAYVLQPKLRDNIYIHIYIILFFPSVYFYRGAFCCVATQCGEFRGVVCRQQFTIKSNSFKCILILKYLLPQCRYAHVHLYVSLQMRVDILFISIQICT